MALRHLLSPAPYVYKDVCLNHTALDICANLKAPLCLLFCPASLPEVLIFLGSAHDIQILESVMYDTVPRWRHDTLRERKVPPTLRRINNNYPPTLGRINKNMTFFTILVRS